jgi:3-isopropylmalate/(R)-2-methylmalate dehydratase small subunit
MEAFTRVEGVVCPLDRADVDTDQIIPKQFLKRVERTGFGEFLFWDWRGEEGFPLEQPAYAGAPILVAGRNFGCGSSREHAPWALVDFGIRAVVSTEFADIFRSNALKNGLVPVLVDDATSEWLLAHPGAQVTVDLESSTLSLPTGARVAFPIEPFARYCLLNGVDELGFLHGKLPQIEAFERTHTTA